MSEHAVVSAVARVVASHPELATLASTLDGSTGNLILTPAFLDAYSGSDISATKRALLLRVLFGDPSVFRTPIINRFTPALAARVVSYLQAIPSDPLRSGFCLQHEIPKPLLRLFGLRDAGFRDLCDQMLPVLWAHATGGEPALPEGAFPGLVDAPVLEALQPLLQARLLDQVTARKMVDDGLSAPAAAYYFDTAVPTVGDRNAMLYLGVLLDGDRRGGRIQNRLPLQLARRFRITPRSVPEALVLADVLTLLHDGQLSVPADDPLGLRDVFVGPTPPNFWTDALASHRLRPMIHPDAPANQHRDEGMFDTSLRFNLARATGLIPGKTARMRAFAPYYASLDPAALVAHCLGYWRPISKTLARRVKALATDSRFNAPALRIRDLGNILALVALVPPEELVLPSVAKFALGTPEPTPTGTGKKLQRRRVSVDRKPVDLGPVDRLHRQLDARSNQA